MSETTVKAISSGGRVAIVETGNGLKYIAGPATSPENLAAEIKNKFRCNSQMRDACMEALYKKFGYAETGE